ASARGDSPIRRRLGILRSRPESSRCANPAVHCREANGGAQMTLLEAQDKLSQRGMWLEKNLDVRSGDWSWSAYRHQFGELHERVEVATDHPFWEGAYKEVTGEDPE